MKRRIAAAAAVAVLALALALAACGHDNKKDLKDVPNVHPDYIVNVENMDGHPNIGLLCYGGLGFATTTREAAGAITRLPEWDAFCATKQAKR